MYSWMSNSGQLVRVLFVTLGCAVVVWCVYSDSITVVTLQTGALLAKIQPRYLRWQYEGYDHKTILLWGEWFGLKWPVHLGSEPFRECPEPRCQFTSAPDKAGEAAVIVFHARDLSHDASGLPRRSGPRQLWVFNTQECPMYTYSRNKRVFKFMTARRGYAAYDGMFNLTSTYMSDSDLPMPYGAYRPLGEHEARPDVSRLISNKTSLLLWLVSNCRSQQRLKYVHVLKQHVRVDVFGKCGAPDPCQRREACMRELKHKYKFYLAFENSRCREYITEKFWMALQIGMVPIVMGPDMEDYKKLAPPNSYLHVDNFTTPEHLAEFLHHLDSNHTAYMSYHAWRRDFVFGYEDVHVESNWCKLCRMAHEGVTPRQYNVSTYWSKDRLCRQ